MPPVFYFAGVGNGCLFFSSAVNIQVQFVRHRSLATALATCGVSLSMFVFPPLTRLLMNEYGWRGCVLNMAAIYMHGLVAAELMVGKHIPKCCRRRKQTNSSAKIVYASTAQKPTKCPLNQNYGLKDQEVKTWLKNGEARVPTVSFSKAEVSSQTAVTISDAMIIEQQDAVLSRHLNKINKSEYMKPSGIPPKDYINSASWNASPNPTDIKYNSHTIMDMDGLCSTDNQIDKSSPKDDQMYSSLKLSKCHLDTDKPYQVQQEEFTSPQCNYEIENEVHDDDEDVSPPPGRKSSFLLKSILTCLPQVHHKFPLKSRGSTLHRSQSLPALNVTSSQDLPPLYTSRSLEDISGSGSVSKWDCGLQKSFTLDTIDTTISLSTISKHSITALKVILKGAMMFFSEAFDFGLLCEVNFVMFLLGSVLNMFGYLIPILFLPLKCTEALGKRYLLITTVLFNSINLTVTEFLIKLKSYMTPFATPEGDKLIYK